MPFDIPDNWTWIRHNSIFEIFGGSQPPKDKFIGYPKEGYIRLYQIRDYGPKPEPVYIPIEDAHKVTVKGDILLARYGASVGKVFFAEDGAYNVAMAKVEKLYVNDHIDKMYLYTFYKSSLYQSLVLNNSRSAQAGFNKEDLNSLLIPLPPLEEQIRIVEKINSFEPLIAQYSIAENRLSILEEEFPDKLKKSILQYAIEGKLVKQDPNDEPASVLLERIKTEKERLIKEGKIKRDKNESYIFQGDDKNYYEKIDSKLIPCDETTQINLPINWAFCYFGNVSTYGYTTTKMQLILNSWLLELEDIVSGSSVVKTRKYVEENTNLNSKVPFKSGMVLYSKLRPYLDKIVIADQDGIATSEIVPFYSLIDTDYLVTFLRSPYFLNRVTNLMYGVKMPRLGTQDMTMTIIPLPPLSEQKRIVKKILSINEIISG